MSDPAEQRPEEHGELDAIRREIDALDGELISLLSERFELVGELKELKRTLALPVEDTSREAVLRALHERLAAREGVDHELVQRLFAEIVAHSKRLQERRRAE